MPAASIHLVARYAVFALVVLATLTALGSWLVRRRHVSPFGALGRGLRSGTDAILGPVERRLVRMGGNPVHAGGWLIIVTAVLGIIFLSLLGWLIQTFQTAQIAAGSGPRATFALMIRILYRIVTFALLLRIVGSWFGVHRYTRWMRPAYILTDWIVEPMRRIVPPLGAFDISPLAAWFALYVLQMLLLRMLGF